jgi:hypothetical protein
MREMSRGRRLALAVLGTWALAAKLPAAAQDPRLTQAQAAGMQWLAQVDAGDVDGTYAAAARRFQSALTPEQWTAAVAGTRAQFGTMVRRTLANARSTDDIPGKPEGEFAMFLFRTEFTKRDVTMETLTLEHEADGKWRVVGYSLR